MPLAMVQALLPIELEGCWKEDLHRQPSMRPGLVQAPLPIAREAWRRVDRRRCRWLLLVSLGETAHRRREGLKPMTVAAFGTVGRGRVLQRGGERGHLGLLEDAVEALGCHNYLGFPWRSGGFLPPVRCCDLQAGFVTLGWALAKIATLMRTLPPMLLMHLEALMGAV